MVETFTGALQWLKTLRRPPVFEVIYQIARRHCQQAGCEVVVVGRRQRRDYHTVLAAGGVQESPAEVLLLVDRGARFARFPDSHDELYYSRTYGSPNEIG